MSRPAITPSAPVQLPRDRRRQFILLAILLGIIAVGLYPLGRYAWAGWHHRRALAAIDRHDFATARKHLDVCVAEWPDSGETQFLAARTARRAGDFEAAERGLRRAKQLGWTEEAIALERSLLAAQTGHLAASLNYLLVCLRNDHPDSLLIVEVLTPLAFQAFDLTLVAVCVGVWEKLEPASPRPHVYKGELAERLDNNALAATEYREAVRLGPDDFDARMHCARALHATNATPEALEHYEWLAGRAPDNPEVGLGRAHCLHDLGRDAEALPVLEKVLADRPAQEGALELRGLIALATREPAEAERWLRKALDLRPASEDALYLLSQCLNQLNQPAEAEKVLQQRDEAIRNHDEARKFKLEVAKNPNDPAPRRELAIRFLRTGMPAEAKRWLESALQLNPRHVPSLETLADCYDQLGEKGTAEEYRKLAKAAAKK